MLKTIITSSAIAATLAAFAITGNNTPTEIDVPAADITSAELSLLAREHKARLDYDCLNITVYCEARSESDEGQQAVAEVILNRWNSYKYPPTICGVIRDHKQFSCWNDKAEENYKKTINAFAHPTKQELAVIMQVQENTHKAIQGFGGLAGLVLPPETDHYHTLQVDPYWNECAEQVATIDNHIFYKDVKRCAEQN